MSRSAAPPVSAQLLRLDAADGPIEAAALWRGGRLDDLLIRPERRDGPEPGEIFAARATRLLPDQNAAFLDLGDETAYLATADGLASGDALLVEIVRPAEGRKAAQATAKPTHRGRLLVLQPRAAGTTLSRKIADKNRRAALTALLAPYADAGGWVARTAAGAAPDAALIAEADALRAEAAALAAAPLAPPRRLKAAPDLAAQAEARWGRAAADLRDQRPDGPDATALAEALDALSAPRVALPGGGRLTIERLEALIAVDVDSAETPRAQANRRAADEIPRQLRLRGLGGMVLIDFAGPAADERARLAAAIARAAGADPLKVAGWGPLGLLELTRRRDRPRLDALWRRP